MIRNFFTKNPSKELLEVSPEPAIEELRERVRGSSIGLIAGSGPFPSRFINEAKQFGCTIVAVCHVDETRPDVAELATNHLWVKVGELGKIIRFFQDNEIRDVALAGGIDRVKLFGNVSLDARGAALLMKVRSMKDDLLMRGIADELARESINVLPCTIFLTEQLAPEGVLTKRSPSKDELDDIAVGQSAIRALSSEHIGQTVVVRDGVVVAVEAVEGTDRCILRGGELSKEGSVVVKCAKVDQDMRFDVPTIGVTTIETMQSAGARVLALEAGRTLLLDRAEVIEKANSFGIAIIGTKPL